MRIGRAHRREVVDIGAGHISPGIGKPVVGIADVEGLVGAAVKMKGDLQLLVGGRIAEMYPLHRHAQAGIRRGIPGTHVMGRLRKRQLLRVLQPGLAKPNVNVITAPIRRLGVGKDQVFDVGLQGFAGRKQLVVVLLAAKKRQENSEGQ